MIMQAKNANHANPLHDHAKGLPDGQVNQANTQLDRQLFPESCFSRLRVLVEVKKGFNLVHWHVFKLLVAPFCTRACALALVRA